MNAWLKISAGRWAAFGASIALLTGVFVVRQRTLLSAPHLDSERTSLEAEKLRLAPFGPEVVRGLQAELAHFRQRGTVADMVVPEGWRIESLPLDPSSEPRVRYVRQGGGFSWTELVAFIAQCEEHTGVVSLDIQSQGTTRQRRISRVEVVVRGTPETTRRQAGATFPGANGPDAPRKIGHGLSLRRPSAFTGRLRLPVTAPGPASAPSRPAPPGSAGRPEYPSIT